MSAAQTSQVDYIIVGQGLAGSAVAMHLLKRKKKILVIDWPAGNISTSVAAGLFNPLTGKKIVCSWKAEKIFPYLNTYYGEAEKITQKNFFVPMPVYRPFLSVEEQNGWMAASADPSWTQFIDKIVTKPSYPGFINDPFGGILLKNCGYIDTANYISTLRHHFVTNNLFEEEVFDDIFLSVTSHEVRYKDVVAKAIIFCEGVGANKNKFFNWLPITPLKGETLVIRALLGKGTIFNRGVYVVPGEQENTWRVGATYELGAFESRTTVAGRGELEEKLRQLITVPYDVVDHQWGVRPTTPDCKPIIGSHPELEKVIIFNGFGTKGISLTPYFSEVLVNWLENGGGLDKDVDINRYKSLYWRSP